jgi:hypothetical protein
MNIRLEIENLKDEVRKEITKLSNLSNLAIVQEIDYLFSRSNAKSVEQFAKELEQKLNISPQKFYRIVQILNSYRNKINDFWNTYFEGIQIPPNSFEKILALTNVNFTKVATEIKNEILVSFIKNKTLDFNIIRQNLLNSKIAKHRIYTEVNTSVAQYDNAVMFEFAKQGNITKFKYDGFLHPNTRPFCSKHLHHVYTISQIEKLDNGQNLSVLYSLGGWNCTHFWTPLTT